MTSEELDRMFTYHEPTQAQNEIYIRIREEGKKFADLLSSTCNNNQELTTAIDYVQHAVMFANASVARG